MIYDNVHTNIQRICKQINASYENNLFDCAAVLMRRLLESLLVLSYQKNDIEADIMDLSLLWYQCMLVPLGCGNKNTLCKFLQSVFLCLCLKQIGKFFSVAVCGHSIMIFKCNGKVCKVGKTYGL